MRGEDTRMRSHDAVFELRIDEDATRVTVVLRGINGSALYTSISSPPSSMRTIVEHVLDVLRTQLYNGRAS